MIAEANAVPMKSLNIDFILEPLKTRWLKRRNILVRSKENEQSTNKINVTNPGFTALARISSTLTKDKAKQVSIVTEKTRSGILLYLTKLINVVTKTPIISHCSIVIIMLMVLIKLNLNISS